MRQLRLWRWLHALQVAPLDAVTRRGWYRCVPALHAAALALQVGGLGKAARGSGGGSGAGGADGKGTGRPAAAAAAAPELQQFAHMRTPQGSQR